MSSRLRGVVAACALAVVLSSCSAQPEAPAGGEHPAGHGTEHPAQPGAEGENHHGGPPGSVELWAVQRGALGVVVTDGQGRVVYRHDGDTNQPPATTCVDACTQAWEPVLSNSAPVVPLGVDEEKLGTVARPDGGQQVTLAGWPLYVHTGAPAELTATGTQSVDGRWSAIAPDGEKSAPPA